MSLKEFQIESKLGDGSYSSVYKVKRITDGLQYAMKKVRLLHLNQKQKQNALNQVRILASIKHPNIIGYKEAFFDETTDSLIIIMEFAEEGDLYKKINNLSKTDLVHVLSNRKRVKSTAWAQHSAQGLKSITGVIQSANIFLCKNGIVKIGDLNVSKISDGLCRTQTGTPYYASPQVWKDQPYDAKSDVWAMGCILYEMTTLKPPFRAQDMEGLYKKVLRGLYQKIPDKYSQDLSNVIRMMLQVIPQLRPDCDKLLHLIYTNQQEILSKTEPHTKQEQNILLETIRMSKNMRMVSEKLPKPDYSQVQFQKIKKSQSRNSCIKNPILPTINKNQEPIKKKRYVSQRKRQKQYSVPSNDFRERQQPKESQVTQVRQNPQSKLAKKNITKKMKSCVSKPTFELPFISEEEASLKMKPNKIKKSSIKSNQ